MYMRLSIRQVYVIPVSRRFRNSFSLRAAPAEKCEVYKWQTWGGPCARTVACARRAIVKTVSSTESALTL